MLYYFGFLQPLASYNNLRRRDCLHPVKPFHPRHLPTWPPTLLSHHRFPKKTTKPHSNKQHRVLPILLRRAPFEWSREITAVTIQNGVRPPSPLIVVVVAGGSTGRPRRAASRPLARDIYHQQYIVVYSVWVRHKTKRTITSSSNERIRGSAVLVVWVLVFGLGGWGRKGEGPCGDSLLLFALFF